MSKRCDFSLYCHCQGQTFPRESTAVVPQIAVNLQSVGRSVTVHLLLFTFRAALRYVQVSLLFSSTVFVLICNTTLLHVSAIHFVKFRKLQIWPKCTAYLSNFLDVWHLFTYIYYNNTTVNINLHAQCVYSWCALGVPKRRIFRSSLKQKKHGCFDPRH